MGKISTTRLPNATPDNYDARSFAELIRQLEQIILQLNFSYQQDNADEQTRRAFFFG